MLGAVVLPTMYSREHGSSGLTVAGTGIRQDAEVRLTMSSREIAELTGKDHKHVLVDIRKMLKDLGIDSAGFSAQYKDSTGRRLACFNLPKRETLILVSGYSVQMRARIIDRWQELEAKAAAPAYQIPKTYAEALALAAKMPRPRPPEHRGAGYHRQQRGRTLTHQ